MYARERACGAEWKAEKAAGKDRRTEVAAILERVQQAQEG